jgi:hypothetical protein
MVELLVLVLLELVDAVKSEANLLAHDLDMECRNTRCECQDATTRCADDLYAEVLAWPVWVLDVHWYTEVSRDPAGVGWFFSVNETLTPKTVQV